MTTDPASPDQEPTPAMTCRVCGTEVPAGAFCGFCGAHRSPPDGRGSDGLRIHAYGASPGEHLLRLSVVSSLFPHLPHRSRTAFRVGLALLIVLLVVLALLRWQAALIAVAALGFPLLFQVYLQESDVYDDLSVRELLLTAALGAGLGVGWAVLTRPIVAGSLIVAIGVNGGVSAQQVLVGLGIPLGRAALMLVPVVLARVLDPPTRESLDGFLMGALGAVAFTAASTVTLLVPQLATGLVSRTRPVDALLVEALIEGVAVPLTAAAAGGLVGAALWFTRRRAAPRPRRSPEPLAVVAAVAVVAVVYAGLGLIDVARLLPVVQACLRLLIAAGMILVLRVGLHAALLNEAHEHSHGEPLLCARCRHVVPDMPFCPNCGVAIGASSRSSRAAQRTAPPVPADASADEVTAPSRPASPGWPGYAVACGSYAAPPVRHTSLTRLLVVLGLTLALMVAVAVWVAWLITPIPPHRHCPPHCGGPPRPPMGIGAALGGGPLPARHPAQLSAAPTVDRLMWTTFNDPDGNFSVDYIGGGQTSPLHNPNGMLLTYTDKSSGDLVGKVELFGEPAQGRSPRDIARSLVTANYPGATDGPDAAIDATKFDYGYEIPHAMVGYQLGYGEIDNVASVNPGDPSDVDRVLVMVAVKNDFALIATAVGPYYPGSPDSQATGAHLLFAADVSHDVNRFTWAGDPPR